MKDYNYNGVTITFEETAARFTATVGGKFTRAPSLDAMKKKIDKAKEQAFTPFDALMYRSFYFGHQSYERSNPEMDTVRVIRVEADKRARYDRHTFNVEYTGKSKKVYHRSDTVTVVTPDTPEARKAIQDYYRIGVEAEKTIGRLIKQVEAAEAKIPRLGASEYFKQASGEKVT